MVHCRTPPSLARDSLRQVNHTRAALHSSIGQQPFSPLAVSSPSLLSQSAALLSSRSQQPPSPLVVSSTPLLSQSAIIGHSLSAVLRQLLCRALGACIKEQKDKKAEALQERPTKKQKKGLAAAEQKKVAAAELADITSANKELQAEAGAQGEALKEQVAEAEKKEQALAAMVSANKELQAEAGAQGEALKEQVAETKEKEQALAAMASANKELQALKEAKGEALEEQVAEAKEKEQALAAMAPANKELQAEAGAQGEALEHHAAVWEKAYHTIAQKVQAEGVTMEGRLACSEGMAQQLRAGQSAALAKIITKTTLGGC